MIDLSGMMNLADRFSDNSQQNSANHKLGSKLHSHRRNLSRYNPPFESDSYSSLERPVWRSKQEEEKEADLELLSKDSAYSDYS